MQGICSSFYITSQSGPDDLRNIPTMKQGVGRRLFSSTDKSNIVVQSTSDELHSVVTRKFYTDDSRSSNIPFGTRKLF